MFSILIFIASAVLGNSCGVELTITEKLGLVDMVATQQLARDAYDTTPQAKQYLYCLAKSMKMSSAEHAIFVKYTNDRQNPQLYAELGLSPEVGAFVASYWFKFCIEQQGCVVKGAFLQLTVPARRNMLELERLVLTAQQPNAAVEMDIVDPGLTDVHVATGVEENTSGGETADAPDDVVAGWITDYFAETAGYDKLPLPVSGELSLFERVRIAAALAADPSITSAVIAQKLGRAVDDPQVVKLHRVFALTLCMPRGPYELYQKTGTISDVQKEFPHMNRFHLNFWFSLPQTEIQYDPLHDVYAFSLARRMKGFESVTATTQVKYETSLIGDVSDAQKLIDLANPDTDFYRFISAPFTMNASVHALLQDPSVSFERVMVECIERTGNPLACTFNGLDIWRRFCNQQNMCLQTKNPEIWTLTETGITQYLDYVTKQLQPLDFGLTLGKSIGICDALLSKTVPWRSIQEHDFAQFLLSVKEIPIDAYNLVVAHTIRSNPRLMNLFYEYAPLVPIEWGRHIVDTWKRVTIDMCTRDTTTMRLSRKAFHSSISSLKKRLQDQPASSGVPPKVAVSTANGALLYGVSGGFSIVDAMSLSSGGVRNGLAAHEALLDGVSGGSSIVDAMSLSSGGVRNGLAAHEAVLGGSRIVASMPRSALSDVGGVSNGSPDSAVSLNTAKMISLSPLKVSTVSLASSSFSGAEVSPKIAASSIDTVSTAIGGANVVASAFLRGVSNGLAAHEGVVDGVSSSKMGRFNIVTPNSASFTSGFDVAMNDAFSPPHMSMSVDDKIRTCDMILAGSAKEVPSELLPYAKFIASAMALSESAHLYLLAHRGEVVNVAELHAHVPQIPIESCV